MGGKAAAGEPKPTGSPRRTVLVVDDEEDILVSIQALIEGSIDGVRARTASSGAAALEILRREAVHLIITDYRMAGMDGLQFLSEALKIRRGIPSIVLTAFPDPEIAVRSVNELGVGLVIAKPFNPRYLVDFVRATLK